jgi:hypothetical protein
VLHQYCNTNVVVVCTNYPFAPWLVGNICMHTGYQHPSMLIRPTWFYARHCSQCHPPGCDTRGVNLLNCPNTPLLQPPLQAK